MACSNITKIQQAAKLGLGALYFAFSDPEAARKHVDAYYKVMEESSIPVGYSVNPNVVLNLGFHVHENEATALKRGMDGVQFFAYSLLHYAYFGAHRPGVTNVYQEFEKNRDRLGLGRNAVIADNRDLAVVKPTSAEVELEKKVPFLVPGALQSLRGAVGSVEQVRNYLKAYEAVGVDEVMFNAQHGRTRHEDIMESLELFGREIMPELRDRDEKRMKEKNLLVGRINEKALARREVAKAMADHIIEPTRGALDLS
jgi:alkanesulfonate monooxygenase SsuD/methylene tetrahydromethanopterin reductase-like flavin-dependent oxidoreductase (luciferase family)